MFEVGKKYKCTYDSGSIYKCTYLTRQYAIMDDGDEERAIGYPRSDGGWTEYKEPVVIKVKRFVNLGHGMIATSGCTRSTKIGEIEIIITDGVLTDVSIVKG